MNINKPLVEVSPVIAKNNPLMSDYIVLKTLAVGEVQLVLFSPSKSPSNKTTLNDNLFAFGIDGELKWQIEVKGKSDPLNNCVANIWQKGSATHINVSVGYEAILNAETGEWTPTDPGARPW